MGVKAWKAMATFGACFEEQFGFSGHLLVSRSRVHSLRRLACRSRSDFGYA